MPLLDSAYDFFVRLKSGTEHLTYGRPILAKWAVSHLRSLPADITPVVVDVGCGEGADLSLLQSKVDRPCSLQGIEGYAPYRETCATKGITTFALDVERDPLPFADASVDVIVMNQVLEHTKDLFFIFSEVSRVLRPGGLFLVGFPNLAAWHDRLMLLLGRQPSGMKVLGPHVRGFTREGFAKFAECDGWFRIGDFRGSAFYPFPTSVSKVLARLFPDLATAIFFKLRRTPKSGTFMEVLRARQFETNYYRGPDASSN